MISYNFLCQMLFLREKRMTSFSIYFQVAEDQGVRWRPRPRCDDHPLLRRLRVEADRVGRGRQEGLHRGDEEHDVIILKTFSFEKIGSEEEIVKNAVSELVWPKSLVSVLVLATLLVFKAKPGVNVYLRGCLYMTSRIFRYF